MTEMIHSVWARFTEAEREITLRVFRYYLAARSHRLESAIAEDILWRLINELEQFERFDYEHSKRQTRAESGEAQGAEADHDHGQINP